MREHLILTCVFCMTEQHYAHTILQVKFSLQPQPSLGIKGLSYENDGIAFYSRRRCRKPGSSFGKDLNMARNLTGWLVSTDGTILSLRLPNRNLLPRTELEVPRCREACRRGTAEVKVRPIVRVVSHGRTPSRWLFCRFSSRTFSLCSETIANT